MFSIIYASPTLVVRRHLRSLVSEKSKLISIPWLIASDFNERIFIEEKSGGCDSFVNTGFRDWINDEGLIDLGFFGQKYTWVKNSN